LPSTLLSLGGEPLGREPARHAAGARAFTAGLAPVTVGLVFATGWLLALPFLGDPGAPQRRPWC
jgi:chromate transporter